MIDVEKLVDNDPDKLIPADVENLPIFRPTVVAASPVAAAATPRVVTGDRLPLPK